MSAPVPIGRIVCDYVCDQCGSPVEFTAGYDHPRRMTVLSGSCEKGHPFNREWQVGSVPPGAVPVKTQYRLEPRA